MKGMQRMDLPTGWQIRQISDVLAEAQAGFACGERDENGAIQLRMNNVGTTGNFDWNEFIRVPVDDGLLSRFKLENGDVVFNNTNSTELVGKSALFAGYLEPVVYSNHFTRLRLKSDLCDPLFFSYWLNHLWHQKIFENICNRWIGQSAVQIEKLSGLEIILPSLPEQQRIAQLLKIKLAAVERARQASEARLAAARELSAAYLREVFESEEAQEWPTAALIDICCSKGQYGTSRKSNQDGNGVPILGMKHIQDGRLVYNDLSHADLDSAERKKYLLNRGDIIFNRTNSAELVGKSAVFDSEKEMVFASYLIRFAIDQEKCDPRFINAYINSAQGRLFINSRMTRAIGQVNISASTMHEMIVPTPPLSYQRSMMNKYETQMDSCSVLMAKIMEEANAIKSLPASLLRQAFSGAL